MILTAFKREVDIFSIPPKILSTFSLSAFKVIIEEWGVFGFFHNSIIISLTATIITVFVGALAGYALARLEFKNKRFFTLQILGVKLIPPIIGSISLFLMGKVLGLFNTHLYLILVYSAFNLPMAIWMMTSFISEIPISIEESARVDGCSEYSIFYRIVLPLILPGLAAVFMIIFVFCWNEFLFANILTSYETKTLPVIAASAIKPRGVSWGPASACGTLLMIPALVVVFLAQKYLVRGLTFGSIK